MSSERAVALGLLFGKVPQLACFACQTPFNPYAARYMGADADGAGRNHFVQTCCDSCGGRSVLTFFVEQPEKSLAELDEAVHQALRRRQALRDLVALTESETPART